jgi:hypothetical protein
LGYLHHLAHLLNRKTYKNGVMKRTINASYIKTLFAAILVLLINLAVQAQEKITTTVTHTETQTTGWLSNNRMWVAGGGCCLLY